jgi:hypothetical protein
MPDRTLLDAMAVRIIAALRDPVRGRWNGIRERVDRPTDMPETSESAVA